MNMDFKPYITRDPLVCGGEPVITGTRITVRTILASLAEGMGTDELLLDFPTLTTEKNHQKELHERTTGKHYRKALQERTTGKNYRKAMWRRIFSICVAPTRPLLSPRWLQNWN